MMYSFKMSLPCIFCWTMIIMSFDTGEDYDVSIEEHVTKGWGGCDGGFRGKVRSLVIYFMPYLIGDQLRV